MKYLYTGGLDSFGWNEARRRILLNMGREVCTIDYRSHISNFGRRFGNLQQKLGTGPGIWSYNRALLSAARKHQPQIFWVDKGSLVQPSTLRAIKKTGAIIVNFNTDYLGCGKHFWRLHHAGIAVYDFYFTSNIFDVEFLKAQGVGNVVVLPLGYYGAMFDQPPPTNEEAERLGAPVGFIGHWESATEDLVLQLIEAGLPLRVRGVSWNHARNKRRLADAVEAVFVPPADFVKCIRATKINLGINSTINRNQASGRSFEIPAAGGFLLAKRSPEHEAMYKEGKEAEFYDTPEELIAKARYYLDHEKERKEIAENGRRRCLSSGTSFEEMMARMVEMVEKQASK